MRIDASTAELGGGLRVRRALPTAHRRMIGAWCFLDHFGPADVSGSGMRIGAHPHIGLQTVTWLLSGELLHRDSLGTVQPIEPGAVNLMTAGRGISHSEESPRRRSPQIHGVQFWIALPDSARQMAPAFEHHPKVPHLRVGGLQIRLIAGELLGARSPTTVHTPLVGASLEIPAGTATTLPLKPEFEHGVIATRGEAQVAGIALSPGAMVYLPAGRGDVTIVTGAGDAGLVLVGGEPFPAPVLMWWNFVGRSKDELARASRDWNASAPYLGEVTGTDMPRLIAPLPPWAP